MSERFERDSRASTVVPRAPAGLSNLCRHLSGHAHGRYIGEVHVADDTPQTVASRGVRGAAEWLWREDDRGGGTSWADHPVVKFLAWMLLAAAVVVPHLRAYETVSQIDELSHFDYVQRLSEGHLVRWGDSVGPDALRVEACRRLDRGDAVPPCDAPTLSPGDFQDFGQNMAAKAWPPYYAVTAVGMKALAGTGAVESEFTAARLVGIVWLGAGLALMARLLKKHRVPRVLRIAIGVLIATTPVVVHASATVNPDAGLLAMGSAVLLVAHAVVTGSTSPWWTLALVPAVYFDRSLVLVVAAALVWIAASQLRSRGLIVVVAAVFALGLAFATTSDLRVALFGDSLATQAQPTPDQQQRQYRPPEIHDSALNPVQVVSNLGALVSPLKNPYLPEPMLHWPIILVQELLDWMVLAGVAVVLLRPVAGQKYLVGLGVGAFAAMCSGPLQIIANHWQTGLYYAANPRFGLSLLPALAVCLGVVVDRRTPRAIVIGLAAVSLVTLELVLLLG